MHLAVLQKVPRGPQRDRVPSLETTGINDSNRPVYFNLLGTFTNIYIHRP